MDVFPPSTIWTAENDMKWPSSALIGLDYRSTSVWDHIYEYEIKSDPALGDIVPLQGGSDL